MKIVDEGPLNVSCLFFLIDGEQMLTFFHKNSVSYELERKKWALTLQYGATVTVLSWAVLTQPQLEGLLLNLNFRLIFRIWMCFYYEMNVID